MTQRLRQVGGSIAAVLGARPCTAILVAASAAAVWCFACDLVDRRVLRRQALALVAPDAPRDEQVRILGRWVYETTRSSRNPRCFVLPGLRATAFQILEDGGDCADKSRLLVAMLETLGIPATPFMLFDPRAGRPCHTLVEAEYQPGRRMVIDPSFKIVYPDGQGGYFDLAALRADPRKAAERVHALQATAPWPAKIYFSSATLAGYASASTIHWNRNVLTRLAFALLYPLLHEEVYQLRRPALIENPARLCGVLVLIAGALAALGVRLARLTRGFQQRQSTRVISLVPPTRSLECSLEERPSRLAWVVVIGLALRVAWLACVQPSPVSDFQHFQALAEGMLDHQQFGWPAATAYRLPFFPAWLAALMLVSRSTAWLAAGSVLLSTALIWLLHALAMRIGPRNSKAALAAAAVCALNPTFIFFSPVLASEHLFVLLLGASLLIMLNTKGVGVRRGAAAGGLLGLAALTRGEAIFYLPVLAAACAAGARCLRRRAACAVAAALAFACVVAPWVLRNRLALGEGVGLSSATGINLYLAHNPDGYGWRELKDTALAGMNSTQAHRQGVRLASDYVLQHPEHLPLHMVRGIVALYRPSNFALFWSTGWSPRQEITRWRNVAPGILFTLMALNVGFYVAMFGLGLAGLWHLARRGLPAAHVLLALMGMHTLCYSVIFWGSGRYRYPIEVIFCLGAGFALEALHHRLARRDRCRLERVGILAPA